MCKVGREARAADPKGWERSCPAKSAVYGPWRLWWPYNMVLPLLRTATWGREDKGQVLDFSVHCYCQNCFLEIWSCKVRIRQAAFNIGYDRLIFQVGFQDYPSAKMAANGLKISREPLQKHILCLSGLEIAIITINIGSMWYKCGIFESAIYYCLNVKRNKFYISNESCVVFILFSKCV